MWKLIAQLRYLLIGCHQRHVYWSESISDWLTFYSIGLSHICWFSEVYLLWRIAIGQLNEFNLFLVAVYVITAPEQSVCFLECGSFFILQSKNERKKKRRKGGREKGREGRTYTVQYLGLCTMVVYICSLLSETYTFTHPCYTRGSVMYLKPSRDVPPNIKQHVKYIFDKTKYANYHGNALPCRKIGGWYMELWNVQKRWETIEIRPAMKEAALGFTRSRREFKSTLASK